MDENISVVIPTYNERDNIQDIIDVIFKEVPLLEEIIIVDDNSADMTWQLVNRMASDNHKIKLIRRVNEKGLPQAIWEGVLACRGKRVLWLDADFFASPFTLTKLLDCSGDYDIAVASRYIAGGRDARKEKLRVMASSLFNKLAQLILQTKVKDLTSGYIVAKKEIFNRISISGLYGEYCVKFLYEAERNNLRIKEVPYVCLSRQKGNSKTSGNIFLFITYCLVYLLTIFKLRLSKNAPEY